MISKGCTPPPFSTTKQGKYSHNQDFRLSSPSRARPQRGVYSRRMTEKRSGSSQGELSHDGDQRAASLRKAGDEELPGDAASRRPFGDEPVAFSPSFEVPPAPVMLCSCAVCLTATSPAIRSGASQISACESIRRKRAHRFDAPGVRGRIRTTSSSYTIGELARFLDAEHATIINIARRLGVLKRLPFDRAYRPFSSAEARAIIQARRIR